MIFNAYSDTVDGLFGLHVKSAGHIFAEYGRTIKRPRGRADYLLFYVAKGSEHFYLHREEDAEEGSFILFAPNERQEHICLYDKTAEFYFVHFEAPEGCPLFSLKTSRLYHTKPTSRVRDLFEAVIAELERKEGFYGELSAAALLSLLGFLARRTQSASGGIEQYADRITPVIQSMSREYDKNYTLEEYAQVAGMSKFHFLRVFKKITGLSPLEYRGKIRMEHAKELLEDLSLSIGEIGLSLGYSSPSYFCDAFKKKTGISPQKYRASLQEE